MGFISGTVLFGVVWFMVLFIVLPIRLRTQDEEGSVVPGTPAGAPANFNLRRTVIIVSAISVVVWAAIVAIVLSGVIDIRKFGGF